MTHRICPERFVIGGFESTSDGVEVAIRSSHLDEARRDGDRSGQRHQTCIAL
jgi:hypothetical protein